MNILQKITSIFPEIESPKEKRVPFKTKIKWTLMILVSFFILGVIPLYGLGKNALSQFEYLSIILGAEFGSLISLGIGPIVTASIVLQLLVGSGLLKLNTTTPEGRQQFQGLQKIFTIFFIIFESLIYVFMGGLTPSTELPLATFHLFQILLIIQLIFGGLLISLMDEVLVKWGIGSGVSLFIAAGVSSEVFIRAFSPLTTVGTLALGTGEAPIGRVWVLFQSLINRNPINALLALSSIAFTVVVFLMSVYAQAMKVEIPLSFGRVRGYGIRWPLKFMYTSNIPVILVAALIANVQLWARLVQSWVGEASTGVLHFISAHIFGQYMGQTPSSGLIAYLYSPNVPELIFTRTFTLFNLSQILVYSLFMMFGAVLFSIFWVQSSQMDSKSQAKQIMASGLQIPGFRRDERILERILDRYILPLTIMGGLAVGFLAASADLLGALTRGTGILLTVMIIYKFYEDIARYHMMDMYPGLRKMME